MCSPLVGSLKLVNRWAGEVELTDLELVSLADQLAEAQAQGLAEAGAAAAMPPPPPQGGTATKRGRSANASASSSPAVTAPKRPTSMFGSWMSNAFGLSTPAQSPAAGVPLPPPLPTPKRGRNPRPAGKRRGPGIGLKQPHPRRRSRSRAQPASGRRAPRGCATLTLLACAAGANLMPILCRRAPRARDIDSQSVCTSFHVIRQSAFKHRH